MEAHISLELQILMEHIIHQLEYSYINHHILHYNYLMPIMVWGEQIIMWKISISVFHYKLDKLNNGLLSFQIHN